MPVVATHELIEGSVHPANAQIYNALDTCLTVEILSALRTQSNSDPTIYNFERALQAPVLEMMLRGFKIDPWAKATAIAECQRKLERLEYILHRYASTIWDKPLNAASPKQLQGFFYTRMKLPEIYKYAKGKRTLSMDRDTLEKLEAYFLAMPIVATILAIRDQRKQLQVLTTEIDPDGRYRTSFNIAGTETGRFSSSKSQTDTGGNAQNISPVLRQIFEADPGYRLYGFDLEQAESREVGWKCGVLFDEWSYYDAALTGDLHTIASKLIWPHLDWSGNSQLDRAIAEAPFYRSFSFRDMAKRGGHGCLTPDHEVLTPHGWVSITTKPNFIMTFDPTHGSAFAEVSNWLDFIYSGKMVEVDAQAISFKATADHRVPGTTCEFPIGFKAFPAEAMPKSLKIPKGWGYSQQGTAGISPEMARFLAAFHSDGHQNSTNTCRFHLHKQRKILRLKILSDEIGAAFRPAPNDEYIIDIQLPKRKSQSWPDFTWDPESLSAYIDEYPHWDGTHAKASTTVNSSSLPFLERVQTIARVLGKGGNISGPRVSGYGTPMWKLQINNRLFATWNKPIYTMETHRVLCPTVPTSFFYIRRKGRISVTGNSNYYGQPFTMARHLKVPQRLMEAFQREYFHAFPGIPKWHRWVATQLQTTRCLTTTFGRTRHFFGRPEDDTTLREAIAFEPQSCTADRTNLILWRLWKHLGRSSTSPFQIELLTQEHDAIYFQAREHHDPVELSSLVLTYFDIPITHKSGRQLLVPGEAKCGWNKGAYDPKSNPGGLRKIKGPDLRVRPPTGLARVM